MNDNLHLRQPLHTLGPAPEAVGAVAILLHGRTQSPTDMFAIAERLNLPGMPFVAVEAAGKSWYPDKFMAPVQNNQPQLDYAIDRLEQLVVELEDQGVSRSRIVLLGFSQGACLACEYLYRYPRRWGGLIAYTGGLIGPAETQWPVSGWLHGTPVFLANSDIDTWVPLARTEKTAAVLAGMGADVQLEVYPQMEHLVNDQEITFGRALLLNVLNKV